MLELLQRFFLLFKLPLQLVPDGMSGDTINLWVPVRNNMPPREVEERVLKPLESLLRTIPGVAELKGNADSDSAYCGITLESGQDPVLASADFRAVEDMRQRIADYLESSLNLEIFETDLDSPEGKWITGGQMVVEGDRIDFH